MTNSPKGKFITVEGIEGVGKSTNIESMRYFLDDKNIECIVTREPGGTDLGEDIRELLLGHKHGAMSSDCELLLMFASRAQHLAQVIAPAIEKGQWVICDRFTDATYAYQGGGRGIADKHIALLEKWVHGDRQPDLTFLLDTDVATGMARVHKRGAADRFESEAAAFFERVRNKYLERATSKPSRITVVDAGQALSQVKADIRQRLNEFVAHTQL
ncbi:MAG: dTMP kinase [Gammaproteobacteria bacterium]|nr:dTMP kinase [Gammaproteobacteria bacterium]PCH62250.1 MAG: dTMP kinase [Gammaproteobacteria bacterium]